MEPRRPQSLSAHRLYWQVVLLTVIGVLTTARCVLPAAAQNEAATPVVATDRPAPAPPTPTPIPPAPLPTEAVPGTEPVAAPIADADPVGQSAPAAAIATTETEAEQVSTPEPPTPPPNMNDTVSISDPGPFTLYQAEAQTITVFYVVMTPRIGTALRAELRHLDGSLATAWWLEGQAGASAAASGGAVDIGEYETLSAGGSFETSFTVTAPAEITEQQDVALYLRSIVTTQTGEEPGIPESPIASFIGIPPAIGAASTIPVPDNAIDANRAAPTADDVRIGCGPDPAIASAGGEPVEVACTFTGEDTLGGRVVALTQVELAAPDGWTITTGTATDTSVTLPVDQTIGAGTAYELDFSLTPAGCEAAAGRVTVSSWFTFEGSEPFSGPSASVAVERAPAPTLLPVVDADAVVFGASVWDGTGFPPVTGVLAVTISEPETTGCAVMSPNWDLQVEVTGFLGDAGDTGMPASALTYLGSQSGEGSPSWLAPVGADLPLGPDATTIASGSNTIGAGGTWNAVLRLDPPDDAVIGTYSGTVSVVVVNAP